MARNGSCARGGASLIATGVPLDSQITKPELHGTGVLSFPAPLPACTVILCTRRRPEALTRCLESLRALHYPDFHILVIENDAASTEAEEIAARFDAEYRLCTRRGLSAARNMGIRLSSTELLAFIDDDATCDSNWLVRAAAKFADASVQAVTGRIKFGAGHEFDPSDRLVSRETADWFGMSNFGGLGLGSNFLVRRTIFDRVGEFDERLGRGAKLHCSEENHLLFRIIEAGHLVVTCSDSVVYHPEPKPESPEENFRSVAASTVMVAMLALEHPAHLFELGRYLLGAVLRKPQAWRERPTQLFGEAVPRRAIYRALLAGPFLYVAATVRHFAHGTPECEKPSEVAAVTLGTAIELPAPDLRTHAS